MLTSASPARSGGAGAGADRAKARYGVMTTDRKICSTYRGMLFIPCSLRPAPRRTKSAGAGVDSILAEMMELGRWGDERHRQVRGLADRSPGVAHGGGDTYSLSLTRSRPAPRRTTPACWRRFRFSGNDGARAVGARRAAAGTGCRRSTAGCCARRWGYRQVTVSAGRRCAHMDSCV
jgi:hypothetical protein